ncbi:uncharacterized protein LOC110027594 [Phalaenopsis equestris]|uniref:uncharacterized protein LOC110027594 n=1 Tax=Phalaenopsis equestris TaxID=78828 RepID=UPI0009E2C4E0|nr:uncharacterized protein LOC110027594 [Phalaenopsis equestris]
MLARLTRPVHLRLLSKTLAFANQPFSSSRSILHSPSASLPPSQPRPIAPYSWPLLDHGRSFTSSRKPSGGNSDDTWKFAAESEDTDSIFKLDEENLSGIGEGAEDAHGSSEVETETSGEFNKEKSPWEEISAGDVERDIFDGIDRDIASKEGGRDAVWETAEGYKPWSMGDADEKGDVFGIGEEVGAMEGFEAEGVYELEKERNEEKEKLQQREQELLATLNGPNRAFGDLIAASGITEDMIDSLILLKDVRGIQGLPPLSEIEDKAIAKLNATSSRAEVERKKQEEISKARVRKVDEKGRAYGTGRRKCSVARVWVQPGDGKFIVNDKQFDAYFPILDHRADLLRPFTVTNTLGLWDVTCTVKGGGVSGQVGAVRLGISRALQCWEPGFRPYLKSAGFLTRDPRAVERKKPGKAKARKSFQWVKR